MLVFDYDKAMAQVRELRQIAGEMARTREQKMCEAIDCVRGSWKGLTGQLFVLKCADLEARIDKEVRNIRMIADDLEIKANMVAQQESEASMMITARP